MGGKKTNTFLVIWSSVEAKVLSQALFSLFWVQFCLRDINFYPPADHPTADSSSVHTMACSSQTLGLENQEWCCEDGNQKLLARC